MHRSPERVLLSGRGQAARHRLRAPEACAVRELAKGDLQILLFEECFNKDLCYWPLSSNWISFIAQ